ncbi:lipopolysaccharide/colanic/teichoic acid biosynthesis glycosyltransferase [Frondihabitans sp. PhB188]|uniref:sugar transferase n=1 Tax=Frondihabitans sp. PhB188 TaxID=2485200 RepID=UPI000FBA2EA5|nr:sugar transferase [Frondihabitans sp. PhB188]ROQ36758.1 lipopolysaccharide/colanic/teichoic acid biosynthesis glycosyltransferase [Frondihabitans sp. PhB188]
MSLATRAPRPISAAPPADASAPISFVDRASRSSDSVPKRAVDLAGSAFGLLLLLLPMLVVAAVIRLTSRGPAIYRQERIGLDGRPFEILKFRTMYADADRRLDELKKRTTIEGPLFKMIDDPRITPVGRVLRRFSIDELPQLVNVLLGDMSLVGPRPALSCEVDEYCARAVRRLEAVPGMTGAWQVGGRSTLSWEAGLDLDIHYVDNWNLRYDVVILARTVRAVVLPVGAY